MKKDFLSGTYFDNFLFPSKCERGFFSNKKKTKIPCLFRGCFCNSVVRYLLKIFIRVVFFLLLMKTQIICFIVSNRTFSLLLIYFMCVSGFFFCLPFYHVHLFRFLSIRLFCISFLLFFRRCCGFKRDHTNSKKDEQKILKTKRNTKLSFTH